MIYRWEEVSETEPEADPEQDEEISHKFHTNIQWQSLWLPEKELCISFDNRTDRRENREEEENTDKCFSASEYGQDRRDLPSKKHSININVSECALQLYVIVTSAAAYQGSGWTSTPNNSRVLFFPTKMALELI